MVRMIGLWLTNTKWIFLEQGVIKLVLISQHSKDNLQSVIGKLARKLTMRHFAYLKSKITGVLTTNHWITGKLMMYVNKD